MFYLNCEQKGNNLLLTYAHNDEVKYKKINDYKPSLYYEANQSTNYRQLIGGGFLQKKSFDSIRDANNAISEAREISGLSIHGNRNFNLTFLHENFADMETSYNPDLIRGFYLDIECPSETGFPDPGKAEWEINAMCIFDTFTKKYYQWGLKPYDINTQTQRLLDEGIKASDIVYFQHNNEMSLLEHMLTWWSENYPTYITGWYTSTFDLPYIANRLQRVGLDMGRLSPWGSVFVRESEFMGRAEHKCFISGIADLDYVELYKKNRFITRESYKLEFIGQVELGRAKVDYSDVASSLRDLHKKDWDLYITYNVVDVHVVRMLEEKLGFIGITQAVAYAAGINFSDVSSPVATWENIIYRDQINNGVVLPPKKNNDKASYDGGYVKVPQVGKHRWVCSFDLNSLYPHLIMEFNISPEKITPLVVPEVNVDMMTDGQFFNMPAGNLSVTPTGNTFKNDSMGVAGQQMERLYAERKAIKKIMLAHEQDVENIKGGHFEETLYSKYNVAIGDTESLLREAEKQVSLKDGGQMVRKILLNSFYGALANVYFCMFDLRLAESITKGGQLAIRWAGRKANEYLNQILRTENVDYVVYTDTDSIYVCMEEVVKVLGKRDGFDPDSDEDTQKCVEALDKFCDEYMTPMLDAGYEDMRQYCNAFQQKMVMAREVISDNSVFCAKKLYAMSVWNSEGVQFDEAYIKIMGLAAVKSSTPEITRGAMKTTIKKILNEDEKSVQDYIKVARKEFKSETPEAVAKPGGVSKVEETYCHPNTFNIKDDGVTVPINSRAAINYNRELDKLQLDDYERINPSDKMKFIHLTMPNKINQNVVGFVDRLPSEFNLHHKIDYDLMFEKAYLKPMRDILDLIGWEVNPTASLAAWF